MFIYIYTCIYLIEKAMSCNALVMKSMMADFKQSMRKLRTKPGTRSHALQLIFRFVHHRTCSISGESSGGMKPCPLKDL